MLPALPTGMQSRSGAAPNFIGDFESPGLLPLDSEGIDRVHQCHRMSISQRPNDTERIIEGAVDGDDTGAMRHCLR